MRHGLNNPHSLLLLQMFIMQRGVLPSTTLCSSSVFPHLNRSCPLRLPRPTSLITYKDGCLAVPPFVLYVQSVYTSVGGPREQEPESNIIHGETVIQDSGSEQELVITVVPPLDLWDLSGKEAEEGEEKVCRSVLAGFQEVLSSS